MLAPLGPWRGIVAITRGGMIPAAIVARELECRLVETVCVAAYDEEQRGDPVVLKPPAGRRGRDGLPARSTTWWTAAPPRGWCAACCRPRISPASTPSRPDGPADTFVAEVAQDTWVLFPWDTAPLFVPPLIRAARQT